MLDMDNSRFGWRGSLWVWFCCGCPGDWDVKQPGITAIAHPASLEVATTHGVFVLQGMEDIVERYRKSEGGRERWKGEEKGRGTN